MSQENLKNFIRRTIIELLDDEKLDETTFSGNVPGYQTPFAFNEKGKASKKKKKELATNSNGYKIVEGKYHDYRNDESLNAKQKIGMSMREVRDKLNELDKLVKMNVRLKNEVGVNSTDYWKNTHNAMKKISERLVKLANKVGQLY